MKRDVATARSHDGEEKPEIIDTPDKQPFGRKCYRHWIEIRDMRDNSVRSLHLKILQRIALRMPAEPVQQLLQVEDDPGSIEARDIESMSEQLRLRYPDGQFERHLRAERDEEAERRYAEGMTALAEIFAQATVDDLLRECAPTRRKS